METWHETIAPPLLRTERQRQALRNAIARRRLEQMREEKALHGFITDVWNEPVNTVSTGGSAGTDNRGEDYVASKH